MQSGLKYDKAGQVPAGADLSPVQEFYSEATGKEEKYSIDLGGITADGRRVFFRQPYYEPNNDITKDCLDFLSSAVERFGTYLDSYTLESTDIKGIMDDANLRKNLQDKANEEALDRKVIDDKMEEINTKLASSNTKIVEFALKVAKLRLLSEARLTLNKDYCDTLGKTPVDRDGLGELNARGEKLSIDTDTIALQLIMAEIVQSLHKKASVVLDIGDIAAIIDEDISEILKYPPKMYVNLHAEVLPTHEQFVNKMGKIMIMQAYDNKKVKHAKAAFCIDRIVEDTQNTELGKSVEVQAAIREYAKAAIYVTFVAQRDSIGDVTGPEYPKAARWLMLERKQLESLIGGLQGHTKRATEKDQRFILDAVAVIGEIAKVKQALVNTADKLHEAISKSRPQSQWAVAFH